MLKNNDYNIDREFDYATVRSLVLTSLEKIVKQEALKNKPNVLNDLLFDYGGVEYNPNNISQAAMPTPLLKLKIRNTTQYLQWRLLILKRDGFRCQLCCSSIKDNKSLRLEVHHPKRFDDVCIENNVTTIEQALVCKELWNLDNGISICYSCHKDIEKLRTKLRNIFLFSG
jgi:hypothetical protein